jgi:hypothetical protein
MVTHLLNHEVVFAQGNKHGVTCLSPCASLILSELFTSVIYLIFSSKWSLYHRPLPNLHTGPTDHQHGRQAHAIKVAIAIFREPIFKIDLRIDLAKSYVDPTTTPDNVTVLHVSIIMRMSSGPAMPGRRDSLFKTREKTHSFTLGSLQQQPKYNPHRGKTASRTSIV